MTGSTSSRVLCFLGIALLCTGVLAQTPGRDAKVGDWVLMKQSGMQKGESFTVQVKQTLLAKDQTTATIKLEISQGEKVLSSKENKIPLAQLRDPTKIVPRSSKTKVEKQKTGKESIELNGKTLACDWVELKVSSEVAGKPFESSSKVWLSPDVPLNGLVKMENDVMGNRSILELVDYGRGK